jgi:transposase
MLALAPRVVDAVWSAASALIPPHETPPHPLGCHRPRIADRQCFEGMLIRLVTGCSWDVAGRLSRTSETTLRRRRDEWLAAGVFSALVEEALAAYDRIIGLQLDDVALDASQHKAPAGGEGTGPNFADRGKLGWKWSLVTDAAGVPIGWTIAGAQRNDAMLVADTLDAVAARGLLVEVGCMHLDRGYGYPFVHELCSQRRVHAEIPARRRRGRTGETVYTGGRRHNGHPPRRFVVRNQRWQIERTNSWLTNFGQLRRNTDRHSDQRVAALELAIVLILTIKLIKWANRWSPA